MFINASKKANLKCFNISSAEKNYTSCINKSSIMVRILHGLSISLKKYFQTKVHLKLFSTPFYGINNLKCAKVWNLKLSLFYFSHILRNFNSYLSLRYEILFCTKSISDSFPITNHLFSFRILKNFIFKCNVYYYMLMKLNTFFNIRNFAKKAASGVLRCINHVAILIAFHKIPRNSLGNAIFFVKIMYAVFKFFKYYILYTFCSILIKWMKI